MVLKDHDKGVFKSFLNGYYTNRAEKPDLPRSGLVLNLKCKLKNNVKNSAIICILHPRTQIVVYIMFSPVF